MALQKTIYTSDNTGMSSNYWKIRSVLLNHTEGSGVITVDGYVSEAARQNGRVPLESRVVTVTEYQTRFSPEAIDAAGMNEVKAAYQFLKIMVTEFQGSEDV